MKKAVLLLVGILSVSCTTMQPINNYPDAIVCDRIESRFKCKALMIKYVNERGVWVYKKIWVTEYEYQTARTGQPYKGA